MKLKDKPSKNVVYASQTPNPSGKGDRLYNSPEYKKAIDDISSEFDSKINPGKSNRQPSVPSVMETTRKDKGLADRYKEKSN